MRQLYCDRRDGNGFTGPLPTTIGQAKQLTRLSFNINNFSGDVPPSICDIPAGNGSATSGTDHDCRIGADTNLTSYQVCRIVARNKVLR